MELGACLEAFGARWNDGQSSVALCAGSCMASSLKVTFRQGK